MTKFINPSFTSGANSKKYRDNFDRVFGKESAMKPKNKRTKTTQVELDQHQLEWLCSAGHSAVFHRNVLCECNEEWTDEDRPCPACTVSKTVDLLESKLSELEE